MAFRVIDGCPCNSTLAPYIWILLNDAGATANSIYRGDDAKRILHAHGKHTQREIYETSPPGVANPPGFSSHELHSDGNPFYRTPRGHKLQWWQQGFDVNDEDVGRVILAARRRGWTVAQPYASGVERHHLNFAKRPRPKGPRTIAKLLSVRRKLPRS